MKTDPFLALRRSDVDRWEIRRAAARAIRAAAAVDAQARCLGPAPEYARSLSELAAARRRDESARQGLRRARRAYEAEVLRELL